MVASVPELTRRTISTDGTCLARGFTGRDAVVKMEGCYHGHADHLLVKGGAGLATFGEPDSAGVPADFAAHTLLERFHHGDALAVATEVEGVEVVAVRIVRQGLDGVFGPLDGLHEQSLLTPRIAFQVGGVDAGGLVGYRVRLDPDRVGPLDGLLKIAAVEAPPGLLQFRVGRKGFAIAGMQVVPGLLQAVVCVVVRGFGVREGRPVGHFSVIALIGVPRIQPFFGNHSFNGGCHGDQETEEESTT